MSEEEIIQEIEKLELEEEKEKVIKKLLGIIIEGKKDIIQEKEFFLKKKEKEIEELKKEIEELKKENFDTVYIQAIENYKDKIREKIKELEEVKESIIEKTNSEVNVTGLSMQIEVLKELLEE